MNTKVVSLCISMLIWSLMFRAIREAGETQTPGVVILVLVFIFYDLVVKHPVFPYPNGKVTWPWKK